MFPFSVEACLLLSNTRAALTNGMVLFESGKAESPHCSWFENMSRFSSLSYKFHRLCLGKWLSEIKSERSDYRFCHCCSSYRHTSVVTGCVVTGCQKWPTLLWQKKNYERQEVLGIWEHSVLDDLLVLDFSTYSFWIEECRDSHLYKRLEWDNFILFFKGSEFAAWAAVHSFCYFSFLCLL